MDRVIDYFKNELSTNVDFQMVDNFQSFTLSLNLHILKRQIKIADLQFIKDLINERDSAKLHITIDGGDPFNVPLSESSDISDMLQSINDLLIDDDEAEINLKYEIIKNKYNHSLSIYHMDSFTEYISKLKFEHLLNVLREYLDTNYYNKLEIQNESNKIELFKSNFLYIGTKFPEYEAVDQTNRPSRNKIITNRLANTSPQLLAKYNFIPSDFHNELGNVSTIGKIFDKLKALFSISFISNSTEVTSYDNISFNLFGHKYIKLRVDVSSLDISEIFIFYDIYDWIYQDGDPHDKLELARNIIGRYLKTSNEKWILSEDALNAIQSAHAIYLKENVEKYIETKNKVAEIVTEMSVKSKEINQFFISSFKNNNLTLLTFFISLFIFNSLSSNADSKIFNIEKYYITLSFLFISSVYLLITLSQFKNELNSNENYFFSMKSIYEDIFEPRELNNLFNHTHLEESTKSVKKTINLYSTLWLIEIIVLFILSITLTFFIKI